MKKRYLILSGIFALFVGLVLAVLAMLPSRPGITKANFDRIEKGMKFRDVDAIFGKKYGWEELPVPPTTGSGKAQLGIAWVAEDDAMAFIQFESGIVVEARWRDSTETIFAKMRRWMGLDSGATVPPPPPVAAPAPVLVPAAEDEDGVDAGQQGP